MGGVCMSRPEVIENKCKIRIVHEICNTYIQGPSVSNKKLIKLQNDDLATIKALDKYNDKGCSSPSYNYNYKPQDVMKENKITHKIQSLEFVKGELIGCGSFSSVYSGLSMLSGEIVAVKCQKFLKIKSESFETQKNKIIEIIPILKELNHENIVKYFCTQQNDKDDEIEIITEFCNGGSIKQLLEKFDVFDEKLIKLYTKQILEGLVYLHEKNIIHKNIKSCNVLVHGSGIVKLSDFMIPNILIGGDPEEFLYISTNKEQSNFN
jgi:RIO-like serine/threonine protein kinase